METNYKVHINVTREMLEMMQYGYLIEYAQLTGWDDEYVLKGLAMDMNGNKWHSLKGFHEYVKHLGDQADLIQSIISEHWDDE